ncbi:MAG: CoA transferase, partial [Deltaproteobacteria bacterium]|nr:CoA transferase [Deltaproteobacteria bacterium]
FWRARSREGQIIRIPALGALLSLKSILLAAQTNPDTWEGFHLNGPHWPADTGWLTKDGQVTFDFRIQYRDGWVALCKAIGLERLIDDPDYKDWRSTIYIGDRRFTYGEVYRPIFASMTSAEVSELINKLGGISVKFHDYAELLAHPQVKVLDPLVNIPEAPPGAQTQMGTPFKLSDAQVDRGCRPAPRLGACTLEEAEKVCAPSRGKKTRGQKEKVSVPAGKMLPGPLTGLKVLDASMGAVGPWAGVLLGALGADVVKLESPQGDFIRAVKPAQRGLGTTYITSNLNKRGIVLDMKEEANQQKVYGFVEQADVFIENFRPGVADRIGLGYEKLSQLNPRLIYASASGFGPKGPLADVGAADPHIQAFSGSTCVNGQQGGLRERMRWYGHFDVTTSLVIVQGVLTALLERQRTGKGQRVDTTMTQATMALQRVRLAEYLGGGNPVPMGSGTTYLVPDQAFATQDRYIAVSATNRAQWQALCMALGAGQLSDDPRFATNPVRIENREILIPLLAEKFLARPAGCWIRLLGEAGVPCCLLMNFNDFRHHIHYLKNEFIITLKTAHWGDLIVGGLPWRFSKTPGSLRSGSDVGECTEEIVKGNWPDPKPGS